DAEGVGRGLGPLGKAIDRPRALLAQEQGIRSDVWIGIDACQDQPWTGLDDLLEVQHDGSANGFTDRNTELLLVGAKLGKVTIVEPDRIFLAGFSLSLGGHRLRLFRYRYPRQDASWRVST